MSNWEFLPPEARAVLGWCRAAAARLARDDGEIGIIGAIILVVGFAIAATLLVAAVKGKLNSWIAKIP